MLYFGLLGIQCLARQQTEYFLIHPVTKNDKKFRRLIKTALHVNEDSIELLCLYLVSSKNFKQFTMSTFSTKSNN